MKFRDMSTERTGETSAQIRERMVAGRKRQLERFHGRKHSTCNAHMGAWELKSFCELDEPTHELLEHTMSERLGL